MTKRIVKFDGGKITQDFDARAEQIANRYAGSELVFLGLRADISSALSKAYEEGKSEGRSATQRQSAARLDPPHIYEPHPKYPWFCNRCGYAASESLKHVQDVE